MHTRVIKPLREIIHISTKVALLQPEELDKLEASCLEFKVAFNASYPGSYPVKAHVVSDHLWRQARKWGTIGWMAEQGVEAYHPRYEDAKITARSIKDPKARMKALLRIVKVKQKGSGGRELRSVNKDGQQRKKRRDAGSKRAAPH